MRVRPTPRQLPRIVELARETPEVVECYRITGDDCFLMKLHLHSMDDLEPVLDRFVAVRPDDDLDHPVDARCRGARCRSSA